MRRALHNLATRQEERGSWTGDYSGPMFLLPMYVALAYARQALPDPARRQRILRYFSSQQHEDGSLGIHAEDERPSLFSTSLAYVAVRMLGASADEPYVRRMRRWIADEGSPCGAAPWGKFVLAVLGLYDWEGVSPVLPELWLLPEQSPFHPSRLWCHCRQVYLPMAWLYARRATVPADALLLALREEMYQKPYARIAWSCQRDVLASCDAYRAAAPALRAAQATMEGFERLHPARWRAKALEHVLGHIRYEDEVTGFIDLGPVNKVLNAFVHFFDNPGGPDDAKAFAACDAYLWDDEDGTTRMKGYNGSELWDTAFAVQAVLATPFAHEHERLLRRAFTYIRENQLLEDPPQASHYHRHLSRGGWPFSNRMHGWPTSDCTAEGLKSALALRGRFHPEIPRARLLDATRLILTWQNADGGFSTYERQRAGAWLESFNPSHVFGDIMVDYSYVECTSACLQALVAAEKALGPTRATRRAIRRGEAFLRRAQRTDGSFEGSWGVCFTYGTWFGITGLVAAGAPPADPAVRRACRFLLEHQRRDGGWGEHGDSCRERRYVDSLRLGATQTAWALSALVRARDPDAGAQARAVRTLIDREQRSGGWAREPMVGVFNRTCLINYDNYRHYFPLWAIAEWWKAGVASDDLAMA
jgi:lanosterol synthase